MAMNWTGIHDLIIRAKAGDAQAWERLYDLSRPYLLKLAGKPRSGDSTSDAIQNTLLRVFEQLGTFDGGRDDANTAAMFRAWLASLFKNLQSNTTRHNNAKMRQVPPGAVSLDAQPSDASATGGRVAVLSREPTGSLQARLKERDEAVEAAVQTLDPLDQAIIRMHYFEGVPVGKIAERLGLTYDKIRGRLKRSLDRLEPLLTEV